MILHRKPGAVVALFPKMPRPVQHPVEAHGTIPIEQMHNLRQLLWLFGLQQVVDMVAHNAERIQLEAILVLTFLQGIEQHFFGFVSLQSKVSIVATNGDVVAVGEGRRIQNAKLEIQN
jgi:hypothetical protein